MLIEPGVYDEAVKVTAAQSGISISGMNRNTVIVDGQHNPGQRDRNLQGRQRPVENLTVRNFDTGCERLRQRDLVERRIGLGQVGASGWFGSYLTAYQTDFSGGYGIFAGNEETGSWENIYASGYNDSGMYIGACQECNARVSGAVMENNSLGYSGSNSGGSLVIEHSIFRHNTVGHRPELGKPE